MSETDAALPAAEEPDVGKAGDDEDAAAQGEQEASREDAGSNTTAVADAEEDSGVIGSYTAPDAEPLEEEQQQATDVQEAGHEGEVEQSSAIEAPAVAPAADQDQAEVQLPAEPEPVPAGSRPASTQAAVNTAVRVPSSSTSDVNVPKPASSSSAQEPITAVTLDPSSTAPKAAGSRTGSSPDDPAGFLFPAIPALVHATQASTPTPTTGATAPSPDLAPWSNKIVAADVAGTGAGVVASRKAPVVIDRSQLDRKPHLGALRNKRTGVVYHHAITQTPKAPKYAGQEPKLERETQTVVVKTRGQQTMREAATQMERPGFVLDTTGDVTYTPGRYQTSEERLAIVEAATRTIQRWVRGWAGRRRAAYLRGKKEERETFLLEQEALAQREAQEVRRKEIERRMHPKTAADFEILYNELEAWRLQETRKIKDAGLEASKEQEVLQELLRKETKLLQTIDRLKIAANHDNKASRIQGTLADMAKPKLFELKDGKKVEVHTPFTTRAKELMQLYTGLNLPNLTLDERLDVLLHVKWTVKEFDCSLTREIVSLIDREADLLNRGRKPATLVGLRNRISSLFLTFIETPEFNPEASRHQLVPKGFEQYCFEKLEASHSETRIAVSRPSKWDV